MALPNLIALVLLSPVIVQVSREYFGKNDQKRANDVIGKTNGR
jgi:Na+/alanine symporter